MSSPLMAAHAQWASRPDDERYLTMDELQQAVNGRHALSHETIIDVSDLKVTADDDDVYMAGHNGKPVAFSHHSFSQFSTILGAPAGFLRKLPAKVAALNLNTLFDMGNVNHEKFKLLYSWPGGTGMGQSRSFNGVNYGRIWDSQVVSALQNMNADGRWQVPLDAYNGINSKQATTLYAGDRNMFAFLVDQSRPIELDGQTYFRGFYAYNSEVGEMKFGLTSFLYSYVCANRMIWNPRNVVELVIKHTAGGPERFLRQAQPALAALAESSDGPVIDAIKQAKQTRLGTTVAEVEQWLQLKGFSRFQAAEAVTFATAGGSTGSSGDPTNLWDVVQGGTAAARDIKHTDARLAVERKWSDLLPKEGDA